MPPNFTLESKTLPELNWSDLADIEALTLKGGITKNVVLYYRMGILNEDHYRFVLCKHKEIQKIIAWGLLATGDEHQIFPNWVTLPVFQLFVHRSFRNKGFASQVLSFAHKNIFKEDLVTVLVHDLKSEAFFKKNASEYRLNITSLIL